MTDLSRRIIRTAVDWSAVNLCLADYLAGRFTYRTREEWVARIISGEITVNEQIVPPEKVLELHDRIEYRPQDIIEPEADLDHQVLFEDDHLMVIAKSGNLCMHPAGPFFKHTLWHLLCSKYGSIHFVNRLDRETSGLLIAVKDPKLAKAVSHNIREKSYRVIVHGNFPETAVADGFLINANSVIRKKRRFVSQMPENPPFESAKTTFKRLAYANGMSLLEATLFTGRMHQIRATVHSLGYPVAGDKLYGVDENFYLKQRAGELTDQDMEKLLIPRQALHSAVLRFTHPVTGKELHFDLDLPEDMKKIIYFQKQLQK